MKEIIMTLAILSAPLSAMAADPTQGADNFYKSDKVTAQKVTFKNQYKMTVAGNLFIPKTLSQKSRDHYRAPYGCSEGAKRESVCPKTR